MERREVDVRQAAGHGSPGDDPARFLRELRELRHGAGLGHAELAARAHFPCDYILAAEAGPALPDLPVLSAYVRGCGGTAEDWEERWRSLTSAPVMQVLPTRSAGCSAAASAGARIGPASSMSDGPDPAIVMRALDRVAAEMAAATDAAYTSAAYTSAAETAAGRTAAAGLGGSADAHSPIAPAPTTPTAPTAPTEVAPDADVARGTSPGSRISGPAATPPATAFGGEATAAGAGGVRADGTGGVRADGTVSAPGAPSHAAPSGRQARVLTSVLSQAPSRITVVALTALAICVLVALLAIFA